MSGDEWDQLEESGKKAIQSQKKGKAPKTKTKTKQKRMFVFEPNLLAATSSSVDETSISNTEEEGERY